MVCPGRDAGFVQEGPRRGEHEELQRQHICPRRTRRAAEATELPFVHETKEHEELQRQHICPPEGRGELQRRLVHGGPRRNTKNCNGNTFVHGGHGGPRRTATATATSFCPRRAAKGHEENHCKVIIWFIHEGPRRTPYVVDADHGRRSRESGEKRSDCARRRPVLSLCEQSSLSVNGTWSVVRTLGPGVDQEIDFGNIDVILPRNWERPVERRRI